MSSSTLTSVKATAQQVSIFSVVGASWRAAKVSVAASALAATEIANLLETRAVPAVQLTADAAKLATGLAIINGQKAIDDIRASLSDEEKAALAALDNASHVGALGK